MTFEGDLKSHAIFIFTERVGAMDACNKLQSDNAHPYWRFIKHQEIPNNKDSPKFFKREF